MQFGKSSAKQRKTTRSSQKPIDLLPALDWTSPQNIEDALKGVHETVTKRAHELIKYYDGAIPGRRIRAKAVRIAQLVLSILVGIGLVTSAVVIPRHPRLYIIGVLTGAILVVAVALTLLDGLCGYSGSWMRYTTACQSVLSVLDQFEIQWQIHLCTVQPRNITNNEAITVLDMPRGSPAPPAGRYLPWLPAGTRAASRPRAPSAASGRASGSVSARGRLPGPRRAGRPRAR